MVKVIKLILFAFPSSGNHKRGEFPVVMLVDDNRVIARLVTLVNDNCFIV